MADTAGAITEGNTAEVITAALLVRRVGACRTEFASHIVGTDISPEAASVGGLLHISKERDVAVLG